MLEKRCEAERRERDREEGVAVLQRRGDTLSPAQCGGRKELDGMFWKVELKDLPKSWMWSLKDNEA